jgi:hypothetical protein
MLMALLTGLCGLADAADPLHVGIPVAGVAGLGEADFLTPELGWTAPIPDGFVRVFVGPSEAAAASWARAAQQAITVPLPSLAGVGDEAWGDTDGLLILRDRNVALQVRVRGGEDDAALAVAETMLAAMPPTAVDWPSPPALVAAGEGSWRVEAPGAVAVRFTGGAVTDAAALTFTAPPDALVAWDAWGRPAVLTPDR